MGSIGFLDVDTLLYATTIGLGVLLAWQVFFRKPRRRSDLPPMVPVGFFELVKAFFSRDAPFFLLRLQRETMKNQKVFALPLAPPGKHFICVADHKMARSVLSNPGSTKPRENYKFFDSVAGGKNFFTDNGPRFAHVRKTTNPAFSPNNVELMSKVVDDVYKTWVKDRIIPLYVDQAKPIDWGEEFPHVTLEVVGQVAFDYAFTREERDLIIRNFRISLIEFQTHSQQNPIRQLPIIGSLFPGVRKGRQATQELRDVVARIIKNYRSQEKRKPEKMIDMIVHDEIYASDDERISDIILYLAGGFDSTAYTSAWTLLQLAKHPKELANLRKALRQNTPIDPRNCPELKRVIREVHRMYPAAALGSLRAVPKEYKYPLSSGEEYVIPKGTFVFMPYILMGRDVTLFEDTDSFVPSRWENPTDEQVKAVMPFSAGKRNCQGQALARLELELFVSKLVTDFDFTLEREETPDYFMTLKPIGSLVSLKKL